MRSWLVAVGFVSVLGQVALLRELAVASYGVELVYVLAMAVWLLGGALGAALLGRVSGRASWLVAAALLPGSAALLRGARLLFQAAPGAYLPLGTQLAIAALALAPCAALLGGLFPAAARGSRSLARAYALESLGGVLGGATSALWLMAGASNWSALLACALVAAAVTCLPLTPRPRWAVPMAALEGLFLIAALALSGPTDRAMTRWTHPALAATRDTPYGRISAERQGGLVTVFDNDALDFDTEGTDAEEFVNLAAAEHPAPRKVLVLGGAASGVVSEILKHGAEQIEAVELDRSFFTLVQPLLAEPTRAALASPRVALRFADPRRVLEESEARYDLILVAAPEPASAATSRFYTREFFALAARRLAPEGILALRLPFAENAWTPSLLQRTASVEHALRAAFPDVLALPASRLVILASPARLERDPEVLAARLRARATAPRAATPEFLRYVHTNDRKDEVAALLAKTQAVQSSDLQPVCFRHAAILWLARVAPDAAARLEAMGEGGAAPWIAFALVGALILACRASRRTRAGGLVALAGFAGMVLETGLVLHYQAKRGVLFQDLGLLLTVFMAGLAAGAWLHERAPAGRPRLVGASLLVLLASLSGATALLAGSGAALGLPGTAAILLVAGAICGALFAHASGDPAARALYAADLAGGFLGALLASLLFFPLLGLAASSAALAPMALAALILVP